MTLRQVALACALTASAVSLGLAASEVRAQAGVATPITVKVIGFNDYHGNLQSPGTFGVNTSIPAANRPAVGGAEYLAAYLARMKSQNPLSVVVGAGDFIGATSLISAQFFDEPAIETLNKIGVEFNAVGNHEFDKGSAELRRLQNGGCKLTGGLPDPNSCKGLGSGAPGTFDGAKFKWLSANLFETATGRTLPPAYGIKTFKGVKVAFQAPMIEAAGVLFDRPHRMAPQAVMQAGQAPPAAAAKRVSSGVLIASGKLALVPLAPVEGTRKLWVRNALGQTTEATQERAPEPLHALGFVLLRLAAALDTGATELAPRDAFAGSPGFAIEYAETVAATLAWPVLRQGFLGAFDSAAGMRWLGIELPPGPRGGLVLDAAGRLAGIAVQGSDGRAAMLPVSMLRAISQGAPADTARDAAAAPRLPADEAYERALKTALQVIAR
jgi:hypothetical protein